MLPRPGCFGGSALPSTLLSWADDYRSASSRIVSEAQPYPANYYAGLRVEISRRQSASSSAVSTAQPQSKRRDRGGVLPRPEFRGTNGQPLPSKLLSWAEGVDVPLNGVSTRRLQYRLRQKCFQTGFRRKTQPLPSKLLSWAGKRRRAPQQPYPHEDRKRDCGDVLRRPDVLIQSCESLLR